MAAASKSALSYVLIFVSAVLAASVALTMGDKSHGADHLILWPSLTLLVVSCYFTVKLADRPARKTRSIELALLGGMAFCGSAIVLPVFESARTAARPARCMANMKEIGVCLQLYAVDFDDKFPIASNWRTGSDSYSRQPGARCPDGKTPWTYAFNAAHSGQSLERADPGSIAAFDADAFVRNAFGGKDLLAVRHFGKATVVRTDGSAARIFAGQGKWSP